MQPCSVVGSNSYHGSLPVGNPGLTLVLLGPSQDWDKMMEPLGTLFVSIPSLLDPSLCPEGTHVFHTFAPDWVDTW
mgnify:CR=1 FL=1